MSPPKSLKLIWEIIKWQFPRHVIDEKSFQDTAEYMNEEVEINEDE